MRRMLICRELLLQYRITCMKLILLRHISHTHPLTWFLRLNVYRTLLTKGEIALELSSLSDRQAGHFSELCLLTKVLANSCRPAKQGS